VRHVNLRRTLCFLWISLSATCARTVHFMP
jgi:hypothetical protein